MGTVAPVTPTGYSLSRFTDAVSTIPGKWKMGFQLPSAEPAAGDCTTGCTLSTLPACSGDDFVELCRTSLAVHVIGDW